MQLPSTAASVSLKDLAFSADYQLEVTAANANGSSLPATLNFTIAAQPGKRPPAPHTIRLYTVRQLVHLLTCSCLPPVKASSGMTKGSVIGIVMVIFLLLLLVVDATCCYRNRCGLLMTIAVKLFGQKVPGLKMLEDGEGATNG